MFPHHRQIKKRCDSEDNGNTTRLDVALVVVNNTTNGSKPAVINNDYH
jgi:hypothetical protein